jgi:hypothetical protein
MGCRTVMVCQPFAVPTEVESGANAEVREYKHRGLSSVAPDFWVPEKSVKVAVTCGSRRVVVGIVVFGASSAGIEGTRCIVCFG